MSDKLDTRYLNSPRGVVNLVANAATVNTVSVTANSIIFLTQQNGANPATPMGVGVTSRIPGTSFTIGVENLPDGTPIGWLIFEP